MTAAASSRLLMFILLQDSEHRVADWVSMEKVGVRGVLMLASVVESDLGLCGVISGVGGAP